jgi:zinc and cadmium transporter
MSPLAQSLLATLVVSTISLVGVFILRWSARVEEMLLGFAAGVLLATAFLDLLPEAVSRNPNDPHLFAAALVAMVLFFVLERLVHSFHMHEEGHAHTSGYLILIGDGLHNLIDGVVIAASFLVSPELGITTTLAVAAHEIPQEIADYGLLVSGAFTRQRALALNFASGLTAMIGAVLCFAFREAVEPHVGWALTATAGMFLYIAASDLIPELHHVRRRGSWGAHTMPFFTGIVVVALLGRLMPGG